MSGHAILDSCHNCGKQNVELKVVSQSATSLECEHRLSDMEDGEKYHHIHITVACAKCVKDIWERP